MKYLMMVCSDGVSTEDKATVLQREIPGWVSEMDGRGVRLFGHVLEEPGQAVTVRVRDDQTLLSDGPFAETKEFIAGFDLIECDDLDEAIDVAAKHPVAKFHSIEVRPFMFIQDTPEPDVPVARLASDPAPGRERYMLVMCVDGLPATAADAASVMRGGLEWLADAQARGVELYSHALEHSDMATTVNVRNGSTVLSDGPFAETKEFVGGFSIVDCSSRQEAVQLAAGHPLAHIHRIEVRPFAQESRDR